MSNLFGNDYNGRKAIPIFEGVVMYFPKALAAVAEVSEAGNKQHNSGEPLHWARGKSMDQYNTALRHLMDHRMGGGRADVGHFDQIMNNGWIKEHFDADGVRHLAKAAWRVLAALQLAIEEEEAAAVVPMTASEVLASDRTPPANLGLYRCQCGRFDVKFSPWKSTSDGKLHTEDRCV